MDAIMAPIIHEIYKITTSNKLTHDKCLTMVLSICKIVTTAGLTPPT